MTAESDPFRVESGDSDELLGHSGRGSTLRTLKRPLAVALGGLLVVRGLRRRSLSGKAMALAGGWLFYRGLRDRPVTESRPVRSVLGRGEGIATDTPDVERSITVDLPAEELHEYWRKPEYLSEIVSEFAQVTPADGDRLHWRVEGPMGKSLSWETQFVEDTPGEVLRWETVEGAPVDSAWTVTYRDAPGERGTEVTLRADFDPPGGPVGAAAMNRLNVAAEPVVATALRRFKSFAETGEIPTLEQNPSARGQGDLA